MREQLANRRDERGFTLIELLIVVVIIGILAAIAIPQFTDTKDQAYVSQVRSDLRNGMTEMETFYAQNQEYPAADADIDFNTSDGVTITLTNAADSPGYCLEGAHDQLDETYAVGTGDEVPTPGDADADATEGVVLQGTCGAA